MGFPLSFPSDAVTQAAGRVLVVSCSSVLQPRLLRHAKVVGQEGEAVAGLITPTLLLVPAATAHSAGLWQNEQELPLPRYRRLVSLAHRTHGRFHRRQAGVPVPGAR